MLESIGISFISLLCFARNEMGVQRDIYFRLRLLFPYPVYPSFIVVVDENSAFTLGLLSCISFDLLLIAAITHCNNL